MNSNRRALLAAALVLGFAPGLSAQPVRPVMGPPRETCGSGRLRRRRTFTSGGLIGVAIAAAVIWFLAKPKK